MYLANNYIESTAEKIHGVPVTQCYFHVYNPYWRSKSQGETDWKESNLLDRFIDTLQTGAHTRKQLGYIALKNGYPRAIVTQCLDLLPILKYVELEGDLYHLTKKDNLQDVW